MEMRLVYLLMVLIICIGIEAAKIPINMDSAAQESWPPTIQQKQLFISIPRYRCPSVDHLGQCINGDTRTQRFRR
ncbi:uncharacterized protein LOC128920035 isoform X4 [Zeugodacus cucurbitae]|uniref:uncharacterized protein LOC128920035 isoform X4 n=1 Tax=Zeugodacus cucurbitae TaxID=28588 RepID=UPI0023D94AB7|nr:uncharacterized protein LOC128920035 isoform X4 [Zeugodacus cucurbitae]